MFSIRTSTLTLLILLIQAPAWADEYVPFDMPYVGASYGRSELADCSSLSGTPVSIPGLVNISDEDTITALGNGIVSRLPQTNVTNCADDKSYKFYGGIEFNLTFVPVLLGIEAGYIDMGRHKLSGNVRGQYYTPDGQPMVDTSGRPVNYRYVMEDALNEVTSLFYGLRIGMRLLDDRLLLFGKGGFHSWKHQYSFLIGAGSLETDGTSLTQEQIDERRSELSPAGGPGGPPPEEDRDLFYGLGVQYNFPQENGNVVGVRIDWDRYEISGFSELDIDVYSLGLSYGFNIHDN